jgi:FkbM family methyltransferase
VSPISFILNKIRKLRLLRLAKTICRLQKMSITHELTLKDADVICDIFLKRNYAPCFPFNTESVIVDIGAHKGFFSLFAVKYSGAHSKIIAIEPEPNNYNSLLKNLKNNNAANVATMQCAVAKENGTSELFLSESVNHSLIKVNGNHSYIRQGESLTVKTITLEKLLNDNEIKSVDFLKIDCEGGEYDILFNASDAVLNKIETIALEFHDLKDKEKNVYNLLKFLMAKSFNVVSLEFQKTPMPLNMGILIMTKRPKLGV